MTMQQTPPAPFMPKMEDKTIERGIDRANARLFEVGGKLLDHLDESHGGWFDVPERERAAAYSLMPTDRQIQAAIDLVSDKPDPEARQMVPSPFASLKPLVQRMIEAPSLGSLLVVMAAIRPDKAEAWAHDAARLGHKIEVGKL